MSIFANMKDNELRLFRTLYVDQAKTAKESAAIVGVSEKTASDWVKKYGLKELRDAKQNAPDMMILNIKNLLSKLAEEQMEIQNDSSIDDTEKIKRRAQLADEVSKWTKALESAQKENLIPLSVYLRVMEMVFDSIRDKYPKIYLQLIDFQEKHIHEVALKYQ